MEQKIFEVGEIVYFISGGPALTVKSQEGNNVTVNWHGTNEDKFDILPSETLSRNNPVSFGAKLVGYNFNPSKDSKVDQVKQTFADLADMVMATEQGDGVSRYLYNTIKEDCIRQILHAQMICIKLLTLKA